MCTRSKNVKLCPLPFFDGSQRHNKRKKLNDPLVMLNKYVESGLFRITLDDDFEKPHQSNAAHKAMDIGFVFKILILQRLYDLPDEQVRYQINDRLSFYRFLDLPIETSTSVFTTVWKIRQALVKAGAEKGLFDRFTQCSTENPIAKSYAFRFLNTIVFRLKLFVFDEIVKNCY